MGGFPERLGRRRVHGGLPVVSLHHIKSPFLEVDRCSLGSLQERIFVLLLISNSFHSFS